MLVSVLRQRTYTPRKVDETYCELVERHYDVRPRYPIRIRSYLPKYESHRQTQDTNHENAERHDLREFAART